MNLRFSAFLIVATLALGAVSTPALPQDAGWFIGVAGGQSKVRDTCPLPGIECDDKGNAWRAFAGYQFNPYIGFEIGYADLGKAAALSFPGVFATKFEPTAIDTTLFVALPITQQLSVFVKGGVFRWDLDATTTGVGAGKIKSDGTDTTWGMGAKYNFSNNFALRLEWQRFKDVGDPVVTGQADMEVYLVGLVYKF
jgi:OmpA-OmpF porin, OOP family